MSESNAIDTSLVARIVRSYVAHNNLPAAELPTLVVTVHRSLAELGKLATAPSPKSAVAVNRSYGRDFVACLECGWHGKMLRRHLTASHALSPVDYRARWNLKDTHPLVAPGYSERRSTLAKRWGFGHSLEPTSEPEPEVAAHSASLAQTGFDPTFVASLSQLKRRGRPRNDSADHGP